ncbi:nucleoside recognition domain-containing protein [Aneurinibacillus aneurinilyticus]|uniref:Ferrous iron transport protein B n=1 Tax=Aneurinibacillus aneurinilyticus ATCC 12856 TaxID=649747 RepID=U1YC81_ANEAE|nr:nucleoside recognition domain-containing protein [Aneurinibacillus aneurinilyticus]ERI09702.1 ferrous iron transport protein B [Aneurinibacillus aneurinilyticus ATCC 12856]MED0708405.1 nucleoside recognition domain-containing protein [Aneurinibacillus aneurinilyticus]MED0722528.1 nucleoside recognition domain-containing protein [Aneurinibacillus aneurinilyticus]MED0732461.1 nucleoside recognition domain-containing protein [Aneurinibacillus aneurinilyticus]MED0741922.1 nucleoside recognition
MAASIERSDIHRLHAIARQIQEKNTEAVRDVIVEKIYQHSQTIAGEVTRRTNQNKVDQDDRLDAILTSRYFGFPIMLILLGIVFWITIAGANVPSDLLASGFGWLEGKLTDAFMWAGAPAWLHGVLVLGLYRGVSWVISVMLPPMAIFFPLFALLEDAGYLPRVAFNLDRLFRKAGGHGKQSLTMAMGFGCNAAGIISCRIIESPRERMIAILTNNFVPCNGRWPTLILLSSLFMVGAVGMGASVTMASLVVVGMVLFGIVMTLFVSWALSKTLLRGVPSHFTLELPPYRPPQFGRTIVRSVYDKTLFVLKRAIITAAPAGVITWILANIMVGDKSVLTHVADWFAPFAHAIGLDGYILMAFLLGLPANEIVVPILIMGYMASGAMMELDDMGALKALFLEHGWTWLTALNMMLFSLLHYPCGTTIYTIAKETKSAKWTVLSAVIPLAIAIVVCFIVAQTVRYFGWV